MTQGPNNSTATGTKVWVVAMHAYYYCYYYLLLLLLH